MKLAVAAKKFTDSEPLVHISQPPLSPQVSSPTVSQPEIQTVEPVAPGVQLPVALYIEELVVEKDQPVARPLNSHTAAREKSGPMTPAKAKLLRSLE